MFIGFCSAVNSHAIKYTNPKYLLTEFWQTYAPVLPNPYKDTQPYTVSETPSGPY